jgi:hypothetical protein
VGLELPDNVTTTCEGIDSIVKTLAITVFPSYKDIDECNRFNPCDQVCTNTEGSFMCSCMDGFQLQDSTQMCEGK